MRSMKWLVVALACGWGVPAAMGAALLTQGSNEIGIAGSLDTTAVGGTDYDLSGNYAHFFWNRLSMGARAMVGGNDWWSYFGVGLTSEYNFSMPEGFRPLFGTDLVPFFLGLAVDFRSTNLDDRENAVVFCAEAGSKFFLTDSTALVVSMVGEMGTEDIYYDEDEPTDKNLKFQLGLRFYF